MRKILLINTPFTNAHVLPHCTEIPEDAECCTLLENYLVFWKGNSCRSPGDTEWSALSNHHNVETYLAQYPEAKVIWKQEPKYKEFLNSQDGYKLVVLPAHAGDDPKSGLIEVPDGANAYIHISDSGDKRFYKFEETYYTWKNGEWLEVSYTYSSVGDFVLWNRHTQDERVSPITNNEIYSRTASAIADAALTHIRERATTYDSPEKERSTAKTAIAFNAITGHNISESEVLLLLQILKDVHQWQKETYHVDSAEDCIAYAALKAEALEKQG